MKHGGRWGDISMAQDAYNKQRTPGLVLGFQGFKSSLKVCMTRPRVQACSMAAQRTGSELQGCLLSPTLFNIFLERIMFEALDDHEGSVSIGGLIITKFRFADDIVVIAKEEEETDALVDHLDTTTTKYKMEIGQDKTKVMTNNPNGFHMEIDINDQRLDAVENLTESTAYLKFAKLQYVSSGFCCQVITGSLMRLY